MRKAGRFAIGIVPSNLFTPGGSLDIFRFVNYSTLAVLCCFLLTPAANAEVKLGNEVLVATGFKALQGKRVGLITNPSGLNRNLESTIDVLRAAPGVKLVALFGPEHGVYGEAFRQRRKAYLLY